MWSILNSQVNYNVCSSTLNSDTPIVMISKGRTTKARQSKNQLSHWAENTEVCLMKERHVASIGKVLYLYLYAHC